MYTNGMTVRDMYKECLQQIKLGNGDKVIAAASDDECNEFHHLWTGMVEGKVLSGEIEEYQMCHCKTRNVEDYVLLL